MIKSYWKSFFTKYIEMKHIYFLLPLLLSFQVFGSDENSHAGARSFALGKASVALTDNWGTFNNQATLALLKKTNVSAYYENRFQVKELGFKAIGISNQNKFGSFAVNYSEIGFDIYKESKIGFSYARRLSKKFWMGIQFDRLEKKLNSDYGSQAKYFFEIGFLSEISKNLHLGFHLSNPMQMEFSVTYGENIIPTTARLGCSWKLSEQVLICSEIQQTLDTSTQVKAGIEYQIYKKIFFRCGFHNHPNTLSFGLAYHYKSIKINLAFSRHPNLGYTPATDLAFQF